MIQHCPVLSDSPPLCNQSRRYKKSNIVSFLSLIRRKRKFQKLVFISSYVFFILLFPLFLFHAPHLSPLSTHHCILQFFLVYFFGVWFVSTDKLRRSTHRAKGGSALKGRWGQSCLVHNGVSSSRPAVEGSWPSEVEDGFWWNGV